MAARHQLPGMRWFLWLRNAALRIGILTGIYVSCTFMAWLLVSNRIPQLEPFAGIRNIAAGAVILLLLAIPVLRFHNEPAKMFVEWPDGMDPTDLHLPRGGNAFHAPRKPHGSVSRVYARRGFLWFDFRGPLGIPDVRTGASTASCASQAGSSSRERFPHELISLFRRAPSRRGAKACAMATARRARTPQKGSNSR